MDFYRESELNRFVRIGVVTVAVLASLGWYMRHVAMDRMRPAGLEPPGTRTWTPQGPAGQGRVAAAAPR